MGAGIAQVAAVGGWDVFLNDVSAEAIERGFVYIREQLDRLVEKGRLTPESRSATSRRLRPVLSIEQLPPVDLVIEAIVEKLDVKQTLFSKLAEYLGDSAVLATNTSSLSIDAIAQTARRPERVIGMHFFNPAPIMPLVEVVAGRRSEARAVDFGVHTAAGWGKTPVRAKDTPGFIVNRVARGYYLEALRLLGEGMSSVDRIDKVMRESGGFRMGPFELMDLVGLDVNYAVSDSVWNQMGRSARFTPHPIQRQLVAEGRLGRKSGRGFYDYAGPTPVVAYSADPKPRQWPASLAEAVERFAMAARVADAHMPHRYIFARILCAVLNEAAMALDENVASAADIDTAMRLGTGYPRGPIAWIADIGADVVRTTLTALNEQAGDDRYRPARYFQAAQ